MNYISFTTILMIFFWGCSEGQLQRPTESEFREILTKNTLIDWKGNPGLWRFEDSVLIGETTPESIITEHSFFIWSKEQTGDFELTFEYKISERGNSGVNYRSVILENKEFVMQGYQADIDGNNKYTGQIYEEKGRAFLARQGQITFIDSDNHVHQTGSLGNKEDLLSYINDNEWNSYMIVAKGNTLIHAINGRVISVSIDHGNKMRKKGFLGFQLHLGPPMKVEYKNILYRKL